MSVEIHHFDDPFCEKHGALEPCDPIVLDTEKFEGEWCLDCAVGMGMITENQKTDAEVEAVPMKIKYFKARIKELEATST